MAAFAAGLAAVAWVGLGYFGSSPLALAMTALIGAVYVLGAAELLRFEQATAALLRALATIPEQLPSLGEWLSRVPPSLQNPVRLRIEGERIGLPGPALTPYLVGLLVLLGMLGTFLGMVVTLNGAVLALESTSDMHTARSALAAPVKGLGFAFGTSVAGVAASAMLGLISALCRRQRARAAQQLDSCIATRLRGHSLVQQRQDTYVALQQQAKVLPEVVDKLQALMAQMERQQRELNERLTGEQERFYHDARGMYSGLAESVGSSLKDSLTESARLAGETIQPVVSATMSGIAQETTALQTRVAEAVERQLEGISARFGASAATMADTWTQALAQHERSSATLAGKLDESLQGFSERFEQRATALLAALKEQAEALQTELAAHDQARQTALSQTLDTLAASLQQEWQQAGAQAQAQQEQMCQRLGEATREIATSAQEQASRTLAEVEKLMATAAEAPRAAAEVIGELRRELSASTARDNELLSERARILETLNTLLAAIEQAAGEQRSAIDGLVSASASMLERAGSRFEASIAAESERLQQAAGQISGGAAEVGSLSEAFGVAVQHFADSNAQLLTALARIEGALDKSMTRSDEQLAYYVAQAREIIDLSIMSQRQILEDLRQLTGAAAVGEA